MEQRNHKLNINLT